MSNNIKRSTPVAGRQPPGCSVRVSAAHVFSFVLPSIEGFLNEKSSLIYGAFTVFFLLFLAIFLQGWNVLDSTIKIL